MLIVVSVFLLFSSSLRFVLFFAVSHRGKLRLSLFIFFLSRLGKLRSMNLASPQSNTRYATEASTWMAAASRRLIVFCRGRCHRQQSPSFAGKFFSVALHRLLPLFLLFIFFLT